MSEAQHILNRLSLPAVQDAYDKTRRRLFMFDYDGTLTPIVSRPEDAIPSDSTLRCIQDVSKDPANEVWIISGRDQQFLERYFGHMSDISLSAEHGCFTRRMGRSAWTDNTDSMDMSWQVVVERAFAQLTATIIGSHTEKKQVAITWHYRNAVNYDTSEKMADICKTQLEHELADQGVEVMTGKANLEVRPRFITKGYIAKEVLQSSNFDFVLCCGDDTTDEDMFKEVSASGISENQKFSCLVGTRLATVATHYVSTPNDLVDLVSNLTGPDTNR